MLFIHIRGINYNWSCISSEEATVCSWGSDVVWEGRNQSPEHTGCSLIPELHFPVLRDISCACVAQLCVLYGGAELHPLMFKLCRKQISVSGMEIAGELQQLQQLCSLPQKAHTALASVSVK